MRRLRMTLWVAVLAIGLTAGSASATTVQVFSDWARGDMGTAHNASNGQYIYCWVTSDIGGPPILYCEAYDGLGATSFCFSVNSYLVNIATGMADSTQVEFGWDDGHLCSFLTVNNTSQTPGRRF
jgi:hypothetical protein